MDTKPIFDFLDELEFRKSYKKPPLKAGPMSLSDSKIKYTHVLEQMKRSFEACVYQCVAENSGFKVDVIESRLQEIIDDHEECFYMARNPIGVDRQVALIMAKESLKFLEMNGFIKSSVDEPMGGGITADISKIDWDKPVYTADEVKKLLGVSDTTFRRLINGGWIAYSQVDGSDKKYIQREHIMAFLNNPKIHYPSTK